MEKFNSRKLEKLTKNDLVYICKHYSLSKYSRLTKAELIELVRPFLQASFHACYDVASKLDTRDAIITSPFYHNTASKQRIKYGLFQVVYGYYDTNSKVSNENEFQVFNIYLMLENSRLHLETYVYNEKAEYNRLIGRYVII